MKNVKFIFLGLAIATLGMSSCKKKEVVGPAGPAGPVGNANVKSAKFVTTTADWVGDQVSGYTATFNTSIITPAIVSTGAVMCYMEDSGTTYALPFSYLIGSFTRHMAFEYEANVLRVHIIDDDGLTSNLGGVTIKIVAISSSGLAANPDLDFTDYQIVKEAFELK